MALSRQVLAATVALVAGLLAGAALAGPTNYGPTLALLVGGFGLSVAALCLVGFRRRVPWPVLVFASSSASAAAAGLLAYVVVRGDSETVASLVSSTVLGALFGAGCAALIRVLVDDSTE